MAVKIPQTFSIMPSAMNPPEFSQSLTPDIATSGIKKVQAIASGISDIGQGVMNLYQAQANEAMQTRSQDAFNSLQQKAMDLTNGENGYTKYKGKNIFNEEWGMPLEQKYSEDLKKEMDSISSTLPDMARQSFSSKAENLLLQFTNNARNYSSQQNYIYQKDVNSQAVKNSMDWLGYASSPELVKDGIDQVKSSTKALYNLDGLSGEAEAKANVSDALFQNFSLLTQNNDRATAEFILNNFKDEFSPEHFLKSKSILDDMYQNDLVLNSIELAKNQFINDATPSQFKSLENAIFFAESGNRQYNKTLSSRYLKDLIKQTDNIEQAVAAYHSSLSTVKAAIKKAEASGNNWTEELPKETQDYVNKVISAFEKNKLKTTKQTEEMFVSNAIAQSKTNDPNVIQKLENQARREYRLLSGEIKAKEDKDLSDVYESIDVNGYMPSGLFNSLSRENQKKAIEYQTKVNKGEFINTNWKLYDELSKNPEQLKSVNLNALKTQLNTNEIESLSKIQKELNLKTNATNQYSNFQGMINGVLSRYGVNPPSKKDSDEKFKKFYYLQNLAIQNVQQANESSSRPLSQKEQIAIANESIAPIIIKEKPFLFGDDYQESIKLEDFFSMSQSSQNEVIKKVDLSAIPENAMILMQKKFKDLNGRSPTDDELKYFYVTNRTALPLGE